MRAALCRLIINLSWQEDGSEAQACAQMTHELKKLGFHTKMETLKHSDGDLDVRERAKTAAWQIRQATYVVGILKAAIYIWRRCKRYRKLPANGFEYSTHALYLS
jgi:hypothetical protein